MYKTVLLRDWGYLQERTRDQRPGVPQERTIDRPAPSQRKRPGTIDRGTPNGQTHTCVTITFLSYVAVYKLIERIIMKTHQRVLPSLRKVYGIYRHERGRWSRLTTIHVLKIMSVLVIAVNTSVVSLESLRKCTCTYHIILLKSFMFYIVSLYVLAINEWVLLSHTLLLFL